MDASTLFIALLALVNLPIPSCGYPLSTDKRWIRDDATGQRVKLACVNWPGHQETMLPEGLHKAPLANIVSNIKKLGFNCVRLTYATNMFTIDDTTTAMKNLESLGLRGAISGFNMYNPTLLEATVARVQSAVIDELGSQGLMVILDNHVSEPKPCCRDNDGNGFWGDTYFDPKEWMRALSMVAIRYSGTPAVVGLSLRNELRGPNQNWTAWIENVETGVDLITQFNTNALIIVSGLNYDHDLQYFQNKTLCTNAQNKLVYEVHRYSFTNPNPAFGDQNIWLNQSLNDACDQMTQDMEQKVGFLLKGNNTSGPVFVSEFGVDETGANAADNDYLPCLMSYLVENDLDWGLWGLQGSYYYREEEIDPVEPYGILNANWTAVKNPEFVNKLHFIQRKIQDPYSNKTGYLIMYHPLSGKCATVNNSKVYLGDCFNTTKWYYQGIWFPLGILNTRLCLRAVGDGSPVVITDHCRRMTWQFFTKSQNQISMRDDKGLDLCLDWDTSTSQKVVTKKCISAAGNSTNPQSQWFKLVPSNIW
ncbi:OLC1v1024788C1 [Oldenlandia corymbosa var. corymbosa]|uniref:OLC1v1024788C1 n=1 Tax=Oldenlandia corymbosa var. corymbosa TaxID=529605 RepID=A0AAV1C409_OLDCO|nr:OLC1v1024788C1 [Oldenlandia corymbosa var. corymbosa]